MSLYRQAGQNPRQALLAGAIALVIGLGVGYLLGAAGAEEPSFDQAISGLRADLSPVSNGLELLGGEYPQGVRNGEIVAQTEYDGSVSNVARIEATVEDHTAELTQLDPQATEALVAAIGELEQAVESKADPPEVNRLRREAMTELESILPAATMEPAE